MATSEQDIKAIEKELRRLGWNASETNVSGFTVTADPEMFGPLPDRFVILRDDHFTFVDFTHKILAALKSAGVDDEYGSGLFDIQNGSDHVKTRRQELVQVLGVITTKDHAGLHFTKIWRDHVIESLERLGWITVNRPVHKATGLPYSEEFWSLEVTPEGQEVVDSEYEHEEEQQKEEEAVVLCIDNAPGGYAVSEPGSTPTRVYNVISPGPKINAGANSDEIITQCKEAIYALSGWDKTDHITVEHDDQVIHVSGRKIP